MAYKNRYLTISVDDGHPTDWKTAALLDRFGLKATFYVPARNPERDVLPAEEVRRLGARFEIGAHTYNHVPLKGLDPKTAKEEIESGKKWLEDTLSAPAVSFCYPRGKFSPRILALVREAGFKGARTCMFNRSSTPSNPFLWGVSTHGYSHSRLVQLRHGLLQRNVEGLKEYLIVYRLATSWERHFRLRTRPRRDQWRRGFIFISTVGRSISRASGRNLSACSRRRPTDRVSNARLTENCFQIGTDIMREQIIVAIYAAIDEVNMQHPAARRMEKSERTKLFGEGSSLDSLGLVNLSVGLEQEISAKYNRELNLLEEALEDPANPFQCVGTLADYILKRLETQ